MHVTTKMFSISLIIFLLCSCAVNSQIESNNNDSKSSIEFSSNSNDNSIFDYNDLLSETPESSEFSDPFVEELIKTLQTSETAADFFNENGFVYYGTEACVGYENLVSFASSPQNKVFYIASTGTTWKIYRLFSDDTKIITLTECWIDTFNQNKRNETIHTVSEIKIYDNRVSIYLENGEKKVIYKKGSELGLPSNNCLHSWQAHYIDYGVIKFINSEKFAERYSDSHSTPYLNFDEYTNTLYLEEEECLMNIYHYVEYYGLTYNDFIEIYGSDEVITDIWGEADIIGYFSNNK